jgi:hypothetical protein
VSSPDPQAVFERRIAQTLRDSAAGLTSSFVSPLPSSQHAKALLQSKSGDAYFYEIPAKDGQGVYRISFREREFPDLTTTWWKRVETTDAGEVWKRSQTHAGKQQNVYTARKKFGELGFMVRFEYPASSSGLIDVKKRLDALVNNAREQRLFDESFRGVDVGHYTPFLGDWAGAMRNSRGQFVPRSELKISLIDERQLAGQWHAGWEFQDAQVVENVLLWTHEKVAGCRDYQNRFQIENDGKKGILYYEVVDHCKNGETYSGMSWLNRE